MSLIEFITALSILENSFNDACGHKTMLYIHPDECIDCQACVPECPVEAIFEEDDVPDEWQDYIQINEDKASECENITERKEPLKKDD